MADDGLRWRKVPGPLSRALGSIGVSALVQSLGDQELDAPSPKVVWQTDRSSQLRILAFDLADVGREDPDAINELVRVAGRHPKELRRAAATIRADGLADEDLVGFRANRLLIAAASGRNPEPVSAEQLARFSRKEEHTDEPGLLDPSTATLTGLATEHREPGGGEVTDT
jgi:hypothetical protein